MCRLPTWIKCGLFSMYRYGGSRYRIILTFQVMATSDIDCTDRQGIPSFTGINWLVRRLNQYGILPFRHLFTKGYLSASWIDSKRHRFVSGPLDRIKNHPVLSLVRVNRMYLSNIVSDLVVQGSHKRVDVGGDKCWVVIVGIEQGNFYVDWWWLHFLRDDAGRLFFRKNPHCYGWSLLAVQLAVISHLSKGYKLWVKIPIRLAV